MALTLSDIGADAILEAYFNNDWPTSKDLTLKLFATDVTPAQTDTASTYTEATGGGYADITITNGSWTVASANDPSDAVYAQQTFTFTGPLTTNLNIYGYYVVNDDGTLLWAERLASAFTPTTSGDTVKITLQFQLSSGTPA